MDTDVEERMETLNSDDEVAERYTIEELFDDE